MVKGTISDGNQKSQMRIYRGAKPSKFDRQRDREEDEFDEDEGRDRGSQNRFEPFSSSSKTGWPSQTSAGKSGGGSGKQAATKDYPSKQDASNNPKVVIEGCSIYSSQDLGGARYEEKGIS
jgi:hypothetical protein